jgi:PAS domain S-box-containing protein
LAKQLAWRVSLIYALAGATWILLSDRALEALVPNAQKITGLQTYKGWFFVGITAALLYVVLHGVLRRKARAEIELRQSEERYRRLFDHMGEGFAYCRMIFEQGEPKDFVYLAVNEMFGNLTGLKDVVGKRVTEIIPELRRTDPALFEIYGRVALTGKPEKFELFVEALRSWYAVSVYSPEKEYFVSVFNVVTERKQAETQIRKLSYAIEQSPVSVVITDTTGRIDYVNRKFTEVTGYSREEAVGANPRVLKSGELPAETYQQLWATITAGGTWAGEFHNRKKDGGLFWEWATISPILDAAGKITHYVAVKEEITERKRVAEALNTSERRFRSLIENASDLITVINGEGIIRFQSPSAERVLGYKPEEMTTRNAFELIHPDDAPRTTMALRQALHDPTVPVSVELRFRHRDGTWRLLQCMGRSIPGEATDGFIIVNSRDITESRKLEERFRQVQKMEVVGQLAGGVAHDFNNILTVIQMQAGLLAAEDELPPPQREFAREISRAAERAADLTRQLLLFSRRQALQPRDLDLNDLITNITKMLQRSLGEDIRMQFKYAPQPLFIHADASMVDQIFMNLAVNSRDAMPEGGQLSIETSAVEFDENVTAHSPQARPGSFACLSVNDTGSGIPPEHLPRIFEPFFTTKDVGKGTGLGLATVFGIVQQHQGWINVYSEVGHGTTFRIYLPRLARPTGLKTAPPPLTSIVGGRETILVVEDEPSLRKLVHSTLTRLGYRVIEAPTGVVALEMWKQYHHGIQLLFTDMVMPDGVSGKDLAQRLLQENPKLKVIYTSGYSAEIVNRKFPVREGVNFLAKPFEAHKLAQTVRNRLDEC